MTTDWLAELSVPPPFPEPEILRKLERYGIALLPGYVAAERLEGLRREVLALLDVEEKTSPLFVKKGDSRVARIGTGIPADRYPVTAEAFSSPLMASVARQYYAPHPFVLNGQVYITHDRNQMDFSAQWHIDPTRSLKFFLYALDTTRENGAFTYAPGSHREGFYRIMYFRSRGVDRVPNAVPEHEVPLVTVPIEAKAGGLVVFEAAGFHRAGTLAPGRERLVIRGHCYPKTSRLGRFLGRLLRRSPLNMSRWGLCEDDRVNERFKTTATPYVE